MCTCTIVVNKYAQSKNKPPFKTLHMLQRVSVQSCKLWSPTFSWTFIGHFPIMTENRVMAKKIFTTFFKLAAKDHRKYWSVISC